MKSRRVRRGLFRVSNFDSGGQMDDCWPAWGGQSKNRFICQNWKMLNLDGTWKGALREAGVRMQKREKIQICLGVSKEVG